MKDNFFETDMLIDYVLGTLEKSKRAIIEKEMEHDDFLRNMVKGLRIMLRENGNNKQRLKQEINNKTNQSFQKIYKSEVSSLKKIYVKRSMIAILIVGLILLGLFKFSLRSNNKKEIYKVDTPIVTLPSNEVDSLSENDSNIFPLDDSISVELKVRPLKTPKNTNDTLNNLKKIVPIASIAPIKSIIGEDLTFEESLTFGDNKEMSNQFIIDSVKVYFEQFESKRDTNSLAKLDKQIHNAGILSLHILNDSIVTKDIPFAIKCFESICFVIKSNQKYKSSTLLIYAYLENQDFNKINNQDLWKLALQTKKGEKMEKKLREEGILTIKFD